MATDNITLALVSLKEYLEEFLDDQGWKRGTYGVYIADDPFLNSREIVETVTNKSKEIGLPLVIINDGVISNASTELGNASGKDYVRVALTVIAKDGRQLRNLANLLRKEVNNLNYTIYSYEGRNEAVSTGSIQDVVLVDMSNYNSTSVASRYMGVVSMTIELDADAFV